MLAASERMLQGIARVPQGLVEVPAAADKPGGAHNARRAPLPGPLQQALAPALALALALPRLVLVLVLVLVEQREGLVWPAPDANLEQLPQGHLPQLACPAHALALARPERCLLLAADALCALVSWRAGCWGSRRPRD